MEKSVHFNVDNLILGLRESSASNLNLLQGIAALMRIVASHGLRPTLLTSQFEVSSNDQVLSFAYEHGFPQLAGLTSNWYLPCHDGASLWNKGNSQNTKAIITDDLKAVRMFHGVEKVFFLSHCASREDVEIARQLANAVSSTATGFVEPLVVMQ